MGLMFSGIDLKSTYNFVVTRVDGRGSPPVSRDVLDMPRVDGDIEINSKLKSRNLVISGYVYGTDVKLVGDPIVIGPIGPVLNAQAYEITFNFVAQDPYFYADSHDEVGYGYIKVNADAPTYLVSPRRQFLRREPEFELYPITIVNLLGKYGNFDVDSNSDGLADSWSYIAVDPASLNLVSGIFGVSAQQYSYDTSSGKTYFYIYHDNWALENHKYFASIYYKHSDINADTGLFALRLLAYDSTILDIFEFLSERSNTWKRKYGSFTTPAGTAKIRFQGFQWVDNMGTVDEVTVDGAILIDLTEMGELPPQLQEFFQNQATNWEDLATTANITAADGRTQTGEDWLAELLPYVDSVATVGYSFVNEQLSVTVENRGSNLLDDLCNYEQQHYQSWWYGLGCTIEKDKIYLDKKASNGQKSGFYIFVKVQKGKDYTLSWKADSWDGKNIAIWFVDSAVYTYPYNISLFTKKSDLLTQTNTTGGLIIGFGGYGVVYDIKLEEGSSATSYEPARNSKLDFTTELFGFDGAYDRLFDNGSLLKQWQRETEISISGGSGTISEPGRGTCILIDETTGLPYTGTVSSTSISTSAPDGTYTVIYQLKTSTVKSLDYNGELVLYPGTNYILLPDHAVARILGNRKYLEG